MISELGRHIERPKHTARYDGVVAGYHAWHCECGITVFSTDGPRPLPPWWRGRISSVLRKVER